MRTLACLAALWGLGCDAPSSDGEAPPLAACSAALPAGAHTAAGPGGASACAEAAATLAAAPSGDLAADGYVVVGPALRLDGTGPFAHGIDVLLPYTKVRAMGRTNELVVLLQRGAAPAHAAAVSNLTVDAARGQARFHLPDARVTLQLALPVAAPPPLRHYTFRALAGVSMGGIGSSLNFWRHTDRFDAVGVMGADPGPDLTYSLGMIHDFMLGGFCTADDIDGGPAKLGQLCPSRRALLVDQGERGSSFEQFLYEKGAGVGLTLRRGVYLKANRDLARAFGNAAYANAGSSYLPPGVPASVLALPNADACAKPVVLKKFYDRRYNPDGKYDVITFCDGNDSEANGYGKIDPAIAASDPVQILLAVDLNANGVRDSGEPVIVQGSEPWQDVGTDGVADADEPGYDAVANPDPNGDDYHYLWNPTGTENNWRYDAGEPYDDVGVDGVPQSKGGCTAKPDLAGCYDFGEGNGTFDYAPSVQNILAHDPRTLVEKLDPAALARVDTYYDAGIRDFFNAQVSTNSLMGALGAAGAPVRAFDGFPALDGLAPSREAMFDIGRVDLPSLGRHAYVRYGDPDLSAADVDATGDGRHAGSVPEAVHRVEVLMYFLASRWPGGDRAIAPADSLMSQINDMQTFAGRPSPFTVLLPPGYLRPENATKRYPVIYFMHGYGMEPDQLSALTLVTRTAQLDPRLPEARRMQKFILVLVDGKCRPGGELGNGPIPTDGDGCETGTFYTDHPEGAAKMEAALTELMAYIDATYRTLPPADAAPPN
jgi:hypothetical protein